MITFNEFLSKRDGAIANSDRLDQTDILQRIVNQHGERFKVLLKNIIHNDMVDDDEELLEDLKQLYKSIVPVKNEFPPTKRPIGREPDIVSRPVSDGGSGPMNSGEQQ